MQNATYHCNKTSNKRSNLVLHRDIIIIGNFQPEAPNVSQRMCRSTHLEPPALVTFKPWQRAAAALLRIKTCRKTLKARYSKSWGWALNQARAIDRRITVSQPRGEGHGHSRGQFGAIQTSP